MYFSYSCNRRLYFQVDIRCVFAHRKQASFNLLLERIFSVCSGKQHLFLVVSSNYHSKQIKTDSNSKKRLLRPTLWESQPNIVAELLPRKAHKR